MARDWRKVALAVLTAATLASVCVLGSRVEAQQTAKPAKAPAKSSAPQAKKDDDEEEQAKAPAKKKRQDPVEAQRAIDAADKLLQGGKAEQAAQALTATLAGGNLPPAIMARALYMRGTAYRQQSKPAQAISDLTSALWLKGGLTAEDRQAALKQRAGAYADAGLTESGEIASCRCAGGEGSKGATCRQELGCRDDADRQFRLQYDADRRRRRQLVQELVQLCGAFGASQQCTASDGVDRQDRGTPQGCASACGPARCQRLVEQDPGQCRTGARRGSRAQRAARPGRGQIPGPACYRAHPAGSGRTGRQSQARPRRGARPREPEIDQAVLGNMGSFYRVRVGPFATVQETQAVCAKVKGTGFDCLTVTQ